MQGYDLKFNDFWCRPLFQSYMRIRANEMGLTQKEMAKRCSVSESTLLRCYGGSDHAFTTFAVLFGLCRGHKFNLTLHMGSSLRPHRSYTIKYGGDFEKFKHDLGSALTRAHYNVGDNTAKPATVHKVFDALNASLIIKIRIKV